MSQIWFFVLLALWAPYVPAHPIQNSTDFPRSHNDADIWNRLRRNSGDAHLQTDVTKLQKIARITNAIYLQQSLISGSIPPDVLISELLHFGSIKPSDISSFDLQKIQISLDSLKDLPSKIQIQDGRNKFTEGLMESLENIVKEAEGLGDINDWKVEDLEKEIEDLAKNGMTPTVVQNLYGAAKEWDSNYQRPGTDPSTDAAFLKILIKPLTTIKSASQDLAPIKSYRTSTKYTSLSEILEPLVHAENTINGYSKNSAVAKITKAQIDQYLTYFDSVQTHLASVKDVQGSLDVIRSLLTARQTTNNHRKVQHTFGLPGGSSDVSRISQDLGDDWIRRVVNTSSLTSALNKLTSLSGIFKQVEDVLESSQVKDQMDQFLEFFKKISELISRSGQLKDKIKVTYECQTPNSNLSATQSIQELAEKLRNIDKMFDDQRTLTDTLKQYLNEHPEIVSMCEEVIVICKEAETSQNINDVVTKFKNYKNLETLRIFIDKIFKLSGAVVNVQDFNKNEPSISTIQEEAEEAKEKLPEVITYHKELIKFTDYFKCLQSDDMRVVLSTVALVKNIRTPDPNLPKIMDSGFSGIKNIVDTKKHLKALEKSILDQKGFKSDETDALALLKDASKHSRTIGLAVQGITNMRIILENKDQLDRLQKAKNAIEKHQRTLKNPKDRENVKSLLQTIDGIQKSLLSLDTFKGSVKPNPSTTLSDHSDIFQKAKLVSGLSENFQNIRNTVEKLKEVVTDSDEKKTLEDVGDILKMLDSMEMSFAKFHKSFDDSKSTLEALTTFFLLFASRMAAVLAAKTKKEEEEAKKINYLLYGSFLLLGILFIGCVLGLVFGGRRIYRTYRYRINKILEKCLGRWWKRFRPWKKSDYSSLILKQVALKSRNHVLLNKKNWTADMYNPESKHLGLLLSDKFEVDNAKTWSAGKKMKLMPANNSESFGGVPLLQKTRVKLRGYGKRFESDYYHANYLTLPNRRKLILGQTPLHGAHGLKNKSDTAEKFWWMVYQEKSQQVFMFNPLAYDSNGVVVYDAYYPEKKDETKTFGDITVKCVEETKKLFKLIDRRLLELTVGNSKPVIIKHYQLAFWNPGRLTENPPLFVKLMGLILDPNQKTTPILHCADGISESGTIGFIAYSITQVLVFKKFDMFEALAGTRKCRAEAVLNKYNFAFSLNIVIEYFIVKSDRKSADYIYIISGYGMLMKREEGQKKKEEDEKRTGDEVVQEEQAKKQKKPKYIFIWRDPDYGDCGYEEVEDEDAHTKTDDGWEFETEFVVDPNMFPDAFIHDPVTETDTRLFPEKVNKNDPNIVPNKNIPVTVAPVAKEKEKTVENKDQTVEATQADEDDLKTGIQGETVAVLKE
ncbi:hypothetical protein B9Z55_003457 [Caenorhabditis nigoni]|uniref:Tyrosine-protein phosphatase domain-containing protein n=1 Tax=Caenorhabditis nigoni TaxID=1611254 RepID=A0A2G5VQC8_9PELO|nr:hypothetical protein B9Z55_003457 [Caenorhabditis nigoni]